VAEASAPAEEAPPPPPPTPLELLGQAIGGIPGVTSTTILLGELIAHVERDALISVMTTLRDDPRFAFEQMMDLCGVDWPEREKRFDVVYNLLSVSKNQRVRVIIATELNQTAASVSAIWPSATWWEREVWDLFGIVFTDQPDMRRILTDYGFEGHPMRKDFPLTGYVEVRYDEDRKAVIYEPVKLTQDWRSFDFLSPWEGITTLPGDEKVFVERAEEARPLPVGSPEVKG